MPLRLLSFIYMFLVYLVALTKTEKRSTREHKSSLIEEVRKAIDEHDTIYVFSYENMRSTKFKNIRMHFRHEQKKSRIFLGKNKLLQIALGRTIEEEYADNLRHISKLIVGGSVGLLCTCQPSEEVELYFRSLKEPDYARAGSIASSEAIVTNDMLTHFPSSMMETFRKLGLPVEIRTGVVVLRDDISEYRICTMGETLSAEKCKLLVHFGLQLTNFEVTLVARWSHGTFEPMT
jgi:mRNA turnover protein 4